MRFWIAFALLAPLLLWQARRARATTPRLPEASGDAFGLASAQQGPPLRLLVVGESTAAGVGVRHHHQGLAAHTARALAQRHQRPVHWHTLGVNGIRAAALTEHLRHHPIHEPADFIIISLGVNDTTGLTPARRYRRHLQALIHTLRANDTTPIYLLAVPPMQHFTALPSPLRHLLGHRASRLDREQQALARTMTGVHHLAYPINNAPDCLAEDGYHPSEKGYRYIGGQVAERLLKDCLAGSKI